MYAKSLPLLPFAFLSWVATFAPVRKKRGPAPGADELLAMSDRDLSDLGIGRSEIPHVLDEECRGARSCAWRG